MSLTIAHKAGINKLLFKTELSKTRKMHCLKLNYSCICHI